MRPLSAALTLALLTGCPPDNVGPTDPPPQDRDNDGFDDESDCDDDDPAVNPDAEEICNQIDDDCNGEVDDQASDRQGFYLDEDQDGFGTADNVQFACERPFGFSEIDGDCDDDNALRHPDMDETCNDVDDNCDDLVDNEPIDGEPWYPDRDQDGYGGDSEVTFACSAVPEHIPTGGDCDDTDELINPEGQEICDDAEADEDCDGLVNDADDDMIGAPPWFVDVDGDGYGDRSTPIYQCAAPQGRISRGQDCEDSLPKVNPDAEEICGNDIDDDCNDHAATCGVAGTMDVELADSQWEGLQSGAELGGAVFGLPDHDGDDRGELGFTQPRWDGPRTHVNVGRAALVYGPALGGSIVIVDHLWEHEGIGQRFGEVVLVAGDLDGDDRTEIWFSTNGAAPASVRLFDLEDESAARILQSDTSPWDAFGESMAMLTDVTDDGVDDIIVGAPRLEADGDPVGAAYVFDASGSGTTKTDEAEAEIVGTVLDGECGSAVDGGDFDGDGESDVVIGCPGGSTAGSEVHLFDAVPTGSVTTDDADLSMDGTTTGTTAGAALAHGDLNDDGYDDLIVGAPGGSAATSTWEGAAYVLAGPISDSATLATADRTWTGEDAKDGFGGMLSTGDVDGDGDDEVLVGVPAVDGRTGRAYLFDWSDGASGSLVASDATAVLKGESRGDFFGAGVSIVPDLDDDGYDDVVVGAPGYFVTAKAAGSVWIWRGGPGY